jgi:hypothetical protein
MEFAGGTYVSQVTAPSPKSACVKSARNLDISQVKKLGVKGKESLVEKMNDDDPIAVDGILNAWCQSALVRGELALINLVQTEGEK